MLSNILSIYYRHSVVLAALTAWPCMFLARVSEHFKHKSTLFTQKKSKDILTKIFSLNCIQYDYLAARTRAFLIMLFDRQQDRSPFLGGYSLANYQVSLGFSPVGHLVPTGTVPLPPPSTTPTALHWVGGRQECGVTVGGDYPNIPIYHPDAGRGITPPPWGISLHSDRGRGKKAPLPIGTHAYMSISIRF